MSDGLVAGLAAGAAALALVYGARMAGRPPSWPRSAVKTLSVAGLAAVAALVGAPWSLVLGLALGAIGDFFLSRAGTAAFLAGMAAFAAGHLAYVGALWLPGAVPAVPVLVALVLLGLSTALWLAPHAGALRWPVRGYVVVITLMGLAAATRMETAPLAVLGAGLFLVSDLLLSLELFVLGPDRAPRPLQVLVWASYWCGQALILVGLVVATAV